MSRWRRLRERVGYRGDTLLALAAVDFVQAYSMWAGGEITATYRWFGSVAPLALWAGMWAVAGLACVWFAFQHDDGAGFAVAWGVKLIWAMGSAAAAVLADVTILGAVLWSVLALLVWRISGWPEPHHGEDHES